MRGPYERLKYDFRRVWECPVCHHRESSTGARSSMLCKCQQAAGATAVWMRMAEEAPRRIDGKTPQTIIAAILKTLETPKMALPEVVPDVVIAAEAAVAPPETNAPGAEPEVVSSETANATAPETPANPPGSSEPRLQDPT